MNDKQKQVLGWQIQSINDQLKVKRTKKITIERDLEIINKEILEFENELKEYNEGIN